MATRPFDAAEFLDDPRVIIEYLLDAIEERNPAFASVAAETVRRALARLPEPSLRAITTDEEHTAALAEIHRLWNSPHGTEDGDKLCVLVTLVNRYESKRWPTDDKERQKPDPQ